MILNYLKHYASTLKHKAWVAYYMFKLHPAIMNDISWRPWFWRALKHDWSKFTPAQARDFATVIDGLSKSEYGSAAYKKNTALPGIRLHVRTEDHHPQYWRESETEWLPKAYARMSKIAKREMLCDWAAAVRRNPNGSLVDSIWFNKDRFGYSESEARTMLAYAAAMGAIGPDERLSR